MTASHTPGPWGIAKSYIEDVIAIRTDGKDEGQCLAQVLRGSGEEGEDEANARLIAAAPSLLRALEHAEQAIEEASDIMHYEDGLPVTALEGWEIERAYTALCSVLVEVHQAIAATRGEQP